MHHLLYLKNIDAFLNELALILFHKINIVLYFIICNQAFITSIQRNMVEFESWKTKNKNKTKL